MLKVLTCPIAYGDVRNEWVYDAFQEAGCQVEFFDQFRTFEETRKNTTEVRNRLIAHCTRFQPDLLMLQIQHTTLINGDTIQQAKAKCPKMKVVNYTIDVRNYIPAPYRDVSRFADFNLISSTGQLNMFAEQLGKPVHYWQVGYDPKLYYPGPRPDNFEWDLTFIANHNPSESYPGHQERERACSLLREKFGNRFALFGNNWPKSYGSLGSLAQPTLSQIYHRSFAVLSVSHYNDLNHYFSDRLLMCLASGRPTISLKFPKWESYFTHRGDLVMADSIEDIPRQLRWLLENPERAEFIGEAGAQKAFSEHTYSSRVVELLEMVGLR